jgi:hypothetical protein
MEALVLYCNVEDGSSCFHGRLHQVKSIIDIFIVRPKGISSTFDASELFSVFGPMLGH